ncbi:TadE family type IV pilus minor pilin [Micromonospora sp. CA-259024]|uniref:TadE family type IV pilus minor pilin n=1 Tax=Micromonospora sp. CA-259024 TaxID=3239965 RepID=UPI003D8B3CE5
MAADNGRRFRTVEPAVGGDRGSFTAELAAGLPALLLLLLAGLSAVNAVSAKAACLHAAREAALAAARGADGGAVGGRVAPPGAEVSVSADGDRVRATIRAPVRTLGGRLPRITVVATAVAAVEPGAGEGSW